MLLALSPLWSLITMRVLGVAVLIALICIYFRVKHTGDWRLFVTTFGLFVLTAFLPFDMSFYALPGKPRFVPVLMGLAMKPARDKAGRGDIILGGCCTSGFDPKWVWVW